MEERGDEPTGVRRIGAWWRNLEPRGRQRIFLGGLVAASLAARDVLMLTFAGSMLAALELAPETAPARKAAA